jgi:hypothetical protein
MRAWMPVLLLGLSATALGTAPKDQSPYRPPPVQAQAHLQLLDFQVKPGVLIATRGGREVWRRTGPLAKPTRLELLSTNRELRPSVVIGAALVKKLLLSEDSQLGYLIVSAYAPATGKPLWENKLLKGFANASGHLAGPSGRTLIVSESSGEPMAGRVVGMSLDSGKTLWTGRQDLLGFTDQKVLLIDLGTGAQPMNSANVLPLTRIVTATGEKTSFTLKIPARPSSGALNFQGSIPDVKFTNRFLYAFRQDAGGKFIARYDWHGSAGQKPLVYRDSRPPVPARR